MRGSRTNQPLSGSSPQFWTVRMRRHVGAPKQPPFNRHRLSGRLRTRRAHRILVAANSLGPGSPHWRIETNWLPAKQVISGCCGLPEGGNPPIVCHHMLGRSTGFFTLLTLLFSPLEPSPPFFAFVQSDWTLRTRSRSRAFLMIRPIPSIFPAGLITKAWKGGSPDIEASISRVDGFAKEMSEKYGVEICDTLKAR